MHRMKLPEYTIIEGSIEWSDRYRAFCRKAYVVAYPKPEFDITPELFSEAVFERPEVIGYFEKLSRNEPDQRLWLALDADQNILGGVAAHRHDAYCEMRAFYVSPELKGNGIGHALYDNVVAFADALPIQIDVVQHMQETIDMYKRWGFQIDETRGKLTYGWSTTWSEKAQEAHQGIYMIREPKPKK